MTRQEKVDFKNLPNPFDKQDKPEITGEKVLAVARNPELLSEMNLPEKLRFTAEALRIMVASAELREEVIGILKDRSEQK